MAAKQPDRWHRIKSVGEGGQAHVFQVEDTTGELPGLYTLKRLRNTGLLDRFKREVEATRKLDHPNILRVADFDLDTIPRAAASRRTAASPNKSVGESSPVR